jgi:two-component system LytT family sensor kinase
VSRVTACEREVADGTNCVANGRRPRLSRRDTPAIVRACDYPEDIERECRAGPPPLVADGLPAVEHSRGDLDHPDGDVLTPRGPRRAFASQAPQWYGWAALTPMIAQLGERFPIRRPGRASAITVHVGAGVVATALVAAADALINAIVRPSPRSLLAAFASWFLDGLAVTIVAYLAIIGVSSALRSSARLREREREASELAAQLRTSQLAALRMQLQPHFLFNSLNAIMALVRDVETEQAVRALSLLGEVLRATIHAGDTHETTLGQELQFVRQYLEMERIRFGDRLIITLDVPEALHELRVPMFVLQPFVENALKHGILRERGGNAIAITARACAGTLMLGVRDDGRGLDARPDTDGVGIANARARLAAMYGRTAWLTVADAPDGPGVLVQITLPTTAPAR